MHTIRTRTSMALLVAAAVLAVGACSGGSGEAAAPASAPRTTALEPAGASTQDVALEHDGGSAEQEVGEDTPGSASAVEHAALGRITREVPAGLALILPETPHQARVARSLPESFVLGIDATGRLWGWAPDGRILEAEPASEATEDALAAPSPVS